MILSGLAPNFDLGNADAHAVVMKRVDLDLDTVDFTDVRIIHDLADRPRVLIGRKAEPDKASQSI